jgi:bifunctional N-acetylglucosamine-1-phosphate-uridyltransferase/glucosamine-1-phosphate-acetyltransferase GlmU-like protein
MSTVEPGTHTLVIYRPSPLADATLRQLAQAASEGGARMTVLTLVVQEPEERGCCDTRSVLWNDVSRGLAHQDLSRARLAVEDDETVELGLLPFSGRRAASAVIRAALARGASEVVLADPRAVPLGPLERRRLRRDSPVPVRP